MDSADYIILQNSIEKIRNVKSLSVMVVIDPQSLQDKISQIRETFIDNWKSIYEPRIRHLYDTVQKGIPTPVLSICGRGTREIRWTKYLSYFLNPNSSHGVGVWFVRSLIDDLINDNSELDKSYTVERVVDEVFIGKVSLNTREDECYCDIVIFTDKFTVFIEQKILSGESNSSNTGLTQLNRYSEAIMENDSFSGLPHLKIYLSPTGRLPEGNSDWVPVKHSDIIACGRQLLNDSTLSEVARGNLLRFLFDLSIGPYGQADEMLNELITLAEELSQHGFKLNSFIRYSYLCDKHSEIIDLILGGVS